MYVKSVILTSTFFTRYAVKIYIESIHRNIINLITKNQSLKVFSINKLKKNLFITLTMYLMYLCN